MAAAHLGSVHGVQDAARRAQSEVQDALRSGQHLFTTLGMTDVDAEGADLAVLLPVSPDWPTAGVPSKGG